MIEGFKHKGLKKFYEEDDSRKLPPEMVERIRDILTALDAALAVEELNRPSFRLHPLKGALKANWAVTVRANWGSYSASRMEQQQMLILLTIIEMEMLKCR